ncbi:MAG: HAD family hydrolase [Roseobacter sp.]
MRIAMWSGPRNLSTAMMYSFGARADFSIMDEPFYAPFLAATGNDHPMRDQIIAAHEINPQAVARDCLSPQDTPHLYMKHMPHHMLPDFPMDWAKNCVNVHLIRHPARVIASYSAKWEGLTADDIGFAQQAALFDKLGGVVIDSFDIRQNPEKALRRLCTALDLSFDPAMLSWPAGPCAEDGVWAAHWYNAVHKSTGFAGAEGELPTLTGHHADLLEAALPYYRAMKDHALKV